MSHDPDNEKIKRPAISVKGKKLLSIYYRHKPGGLCKRMYMMFDAWVARGGEVHTISAEAFPLSHPKIIQHILWTPFRNKESALFWVYFFCMTPFYTLLIAYRFQIDIVSVFSGIYGFLSGLAKVILRKPLVVFVRADVDEINQLQSCSATRIFTENMLMNCGFRWADLILSVSAHLREMISSCHRVDPRKITVLNNHISLLVPDAATKKAARKNLGISESDFVLVSIAVLGKGKNLEMLIRAGLHLSKRSYFFVVGEGHDRVRLEALAALASETTQFIFTGWKEDVSEVLCAADLFISPSKSEGCSNALLEALSYGVACLGSDIAGNREVLQDPALLFDLDDDLGLSKKIDTMNTDQEFFKEVKRLSAEARKRYVFDWEEAVVSRHAEVLSSTRSPLTSGAS